MFRHLAIWYLLLTFIFLINPQKSESSAYCSSHNIEGYYELGGYGVEGYFGLWRIPVTVHSDTSTWLKTSNIERLFGEPGIGERDNLL